MNKFFYFLLCSFLLLTACNRELESDLLPDGEGIWITLSPQSMTSVASRADEEIDITDDTRIEHVILYAFDANNKLLKRIQQNIGTPQRMENTAPVYKIHLLLKSNDPVKLVAVCNYSELWDSNITTLQELNERILKGSMANCAFQGLIVMSGMTEITSSDLESQAHLSLPVKRTAAKINFSVTFNPEEATDKFLLSRVSICNVPLRSYIIERAPDYTINEQGDFHDAKGDAVHAVTKEAYLDKATLKTDTEGNTTSTEFYLFENRRGRKNDISYFKKKFALTQYYQTLMGELGEAEYPDASYILIEGIYISANGKRTENVAYKVYIGEPQPYGKDIPNNDHFNFNDFNVIRNAHYTLHTTIRAADDIDTRIHAELLTRSSITPFFNSPLDAHYGVAMCYGYTGNKDWEIFVKDPDKHPWLEISFSPKYLPHKAGQTVPPEKAHLYPGTYFKSQGKALSQYFYIHTDEYIPENFSADESLNVHNNKYIVLDSAMWRSGEIILHDKVNHTKAIFKVWQRPAQVVRMPLKDALGHPTGKYNEYYVEYELEHTGLQFGFLRYGANPVMTSMINDRWDGLANTRRLYEEAIKLGGAYNPQTNSDLLHPVYQYDTPYKAALALAENAKEHLIGYMTTKNRDRNGNGCIDYDEIEWYVPAVDELAYLWEVVEKKQLIFENMEGRFHSSTPYLAGYTADVPGRSFYVKTVNGKKKTAFTMRNRYYNIICCRRKNAWMGKPDGEIDGNINVDTGWENEDNEIMPKN